MVGRRARKSMSGAANDSTTKFPISDKVPLEWLMHRLASLRPGHAQSVEVFVTPVPALTIVLGDVSRPSNVRASEMINVLVGTTAVSPSPPLSLFIALRLSF
ncbi:hypothetical protein V6N13_000720 [Hibiscus sabdariffa]